MTQLAIITPSSALDAAVRRRPTEGRRSTRFTSENPKVSGSLYKLSIEPRSGRSYFFVRTFDGKVSTKRTLSRGQIVMN